MDSIPIKHDFRKRLFDICFSSLALLFFSPLFLIVALLIKCSSKGPIFFADQRVGRGGRLFRCWKLRTMCIDASERLQNLLSSDPKIKKEWDLFQKLKDDPRITRIGKWLRRTSLDELPQFLNVLLGDLSVVGPRPLSQREVELIASENRQLLTKYLSIRPGLTGLWQISGRNTLTFRERWPLDEFYIDSRNFLFDLQLILKTIPHFFFPKGAC